MPVDMHVRYRGDDLAEFKAFLGRAAGELPREVFSEGGELFRQLVAKHPPPKPGSDYVRTGTLGAGFRVNVNPNQFRVRNNVSYASFVVGKYRRPYHAATGWRTPREVWEQQGEVVRARMRAAIFRRWSRRSL